MKLPNIENEIMNNTNISRNININCIQSLTMENIISQKSVSVNTNISRNVNIQFHLKSNNGKYIQSEK